MNRTETAMVLDLIRAHYWQTLKSGENNRALMLETWTQVLADIPLRPYGEKALSWWLKHEKWPPQAAELRKRAREYMADDREERENEEQKLYLAAGPPKHDTSLPSLIAEWNRRRKLGLANEEQAS